MFGLSAYQVLQYPRSGDGRVANCREFFQPRGRHDCGHSSARPEFKACVTPSQPFVIVLVSDVFRHWLVDVGGSFIAASAMALAVIRYSAAVG